MICAAPRATLWPSYPRRDRLVPRHHLPVELVHRGDRTSASRDGVSGRAHRPNRPTFKQIDGQELARTWARDSDRAAFETETYLDMDLKLGFAIGLDRSADFVDFEPVDVAQRLAGLFECVAHAAVNALVGDADHVDYLVGFIGHGIFSWRLHAS